MRAIAATVGGRACLALGCLATALLAGGLEPVPDGGSSPFAGAEPARPAGEIDRLIFARLAQDGVEPALVCSDAVFVRRVYLDVLGTLPTSLEAREFLRDRGSDKRRLLVDRLLGRPEYADYAAMRWGDVLRIKAEFPINLWPNAVQAYHRWLHTSLRDNVPYDRFARDLLTASGSNFRVGPVNFYRAMQNREASGMAQAVALTLMGVRAEHWPSNRLAGLAAFFSQVGFKSTGEWKEEIVFHDAGMATNGLWKAARFPDGKAVALSPDADPRAVFADWLVDPANPWFTRAMANRVWYWLMGRGIVQEPDDLRDDNPPSHPELLSYLARELVGSKYDVKHLYRLILNSQTYQLACLPAGGRRPAENLFAHYPLRRLEAEVLADAICQLTDSVEKYSSPIPEPFTFIPEGERSIALADASTTSPFLELFGRSPRDTGLASERNNRPSAAQKLHLLNSSHVQKKIEQSKMVAFQSQGGKPPREIASAMYLGVLSRYPTDEELRRVEQHFQRPGATPRESVVDLAWALINTTEFQYRH